MPVSIPELTRQVMTGRENQAVREYLIGAEAQIIRDLVDQDREAYRDFLDSEDL